MKLITDIGQFLDGRKYWCKLKGCKNEEAIIQTYSNNDGLKTLGRFNVMFGHIDCILNTWDVIGPILVIEKPDFDLYIDSYYNSEF